MKILLTDSTRILTMRSYGKDDPATLITVIPRRFDFGQGYGLDIDVEAAGGCHFKEGWDGGQDLVRRWARDQLSRDLRESLLQVLG